MLLSEFGKISIMLLTKSFNKLIMGESMVSEISVILILQVSKSCLVLSILLCKLPGVIGSHALQLTTMSCNHVIDFLSVPLVETSHFLILLLTLSVVSIILLLLFSLVKIGLMDKLLAQVSDFVIFELNSGVMLFVLLVELLKMSLLNFSSSSLLLLDLILQVLDILFQSLVELLFILGVLLQFFSCRGNFDAKFCTGSLTFLESFDILVNIVLEVFKCRQLSIQSIYHILVMLNINASILECQL